MASSSIIIPPDIITEILYRLPAKSISRFRCVSKDWLSLTTKPEFIKTHQKTLNRNHLIFVSNEYALFSLPFHDHDEPILVPNVIRLDSHLVEFAFHGSCNGLVLVSAYDYESSHEKKIVVLNPSTKEFVELPESGYDILEDHSNIEIIYGFGYDYVNDDYKVVALSYFHNHYLIPPPYTIYVHVFSLRTNTWKRVTHCPYDDFLGKSNLAVFVNGFIHFIATKGYDCSPVIVAFSLKDETFREVYLGNGVDIVSRDGCKLAVVGDKLAIFLEVERVVWLMNEYGVRESWTKILIHGLDEIPMHKPMVFDDNGQILVASNDRMLIYVIEKRYFSENVVISRNQELMVKGAYVESLVSPKLG